MLRTPRNYEFDKLESKLNELEYKIDVNDQLTFQLLSFLPMSHEIHLGVQYFNFFHCNEIRKGGCKDLL